MYARLLRPDVDADVLEEQLHRAQQARLLLAVRLGDDELQLMIRQHRDVIVDFVDSHRNGAGYELSILGVRGVGLWLLRAGDVSNAQRFLAEYLCL